MAPPTISPATPDERLAASRLLFADRPVSQRWILSDSLLGLLATAQIDPAGLFVARDAAGTIRGAVLAQAMPGALGLVWLPRVEPGPDCPLVEDSLVVTACAWLRDRGVKVCQSFVPLPERSDAAPLLRNGFRHITRVVYMRRDVPAVITTPSRLKLHPFDADPGTFTTTLLGTYIGSLDCPELTGSRTTDELLDGFRVAGRAGGWWFLATAENEPVGVVMWEPSADVGVMDLSYLGLISAARGRGFGDELVRDTLRFAREQGLTAVELCVDERNAPALRLYRRHGFREDDWREVFLATWPG